MTNASTILLLFGFILTGSISPIFVEIISMNGGAENSTMLILLPSTIGMSLSILFNLSACKIGRIQWKYLIFLTIIELFSSKLTFHGLIDAGSTIFTVVYCSVTMFTAIFAFLFLDRKLHIMQWIGISIVTFGLTIVLIDSKNDGSDVTYGIILILIGAMLHSFSYIIVEYLLIITEDPIAPEYMCTLLGLLSGLINISWQIVYTIPRFDHLVVSNIIQHHGSIILILSLYLILIITSLINSSSFYIILRSLGSASTGILKGVQAVTTFISSHYAFCSIQRSQCFTPMKGLSLCIVLLGVVMYSFFHDSSYNDINNHILDQDDEFVDLSISKAIEIPIIISNKLDKDDYINNEKQLFISKFLKNNNYTIPTTKIQNYSNAYQYECNDNFQI